MFGLTLGFEVGALLGIYTSVLLCTRSEFVYRKDSNQGIFLSVKNFIFVSLTSFIILLPVPFLFEDNTVSWALYVSACLYVSTLLGFFVGGGLPVVQHAILRIVLLSQGHIPWNYARFLTYTTERRLTQQIGGRFRFIHRELLDHFAAMDIKESQSNSN